LGAQGALIGLLADDDGLVTARRPVEVPGRSRYYIGIIG
jgi:hypothetical protein